MQIFAYLASALIGISLRLIVGGSIMAVPFLVYIFETSLLLATSYSLLLQYQQV